jgi:anti-sigma B factor antagonist
MGTLERLTKPPCASTLMLQIEPDTTAATVHAAGEIDLSCAEELRAAVARLCADGHRDVVLDLTDLCFCDVSGLRAFLSANELLRAAGGHLCVTGASPLLRRVMAITRLTEILDVR